VRDPCEHVARADGVLRLHPGTDANRELPRHAVDMPVDDEQVAEVRMRALVERAHQVDPRLHAEDAAVPRDPVRRGCLVHWRDIVHDPWTTRMVGHYNQRQGRSG